MNDNAQTLRFYTLFLGLFH